MYLDLSSFVKQDLKILQYHYDVKAVQWTWTGVLTLIKDVYKTDLCFIWFADIHAACTVLFSKLFGKRSIVVVGGYDVANVPEIDYGLMRHPISARRVKYVLENAEKLLAVSKSTKNEIINYSNKRNIKIVYNGIDTNKFKPAGKKEDLVITVSVGSKFNRVRLKGLDVFVKSAKFLPHIKFLVIGLHGEALEKLQSIASSNVEFVAPLPHDELISYYRRAKVYVQVSLRESFGLSLAESMLCDCVPVVTNRGAIPEVVGDTGFYVPYANAKATAEAIEKALKSNKGKSARERIKTMFSSEKRQKKLVEIINKLR